VVAKIDIWYLKHLRLFQTMSDTCKEKISDKMFKYNSQQCFAECI